MDVFDTWLERTNGCPLNFTVYLALYRAPSEAHGLAESQIVALISRQRQWRDVDLDCRDLCSSPKLPGINLVEMPMLTSLSLTFQGCSKEIECVRIAIMNSPELRRLRLRGIFDLDTDEKLNNDSTGPSIIETTSSGVSPLRLCLDLMKSAPNLELFHAELHPRRYNIFSYSNENHGMILPGLRCLYLDSEGENGPTFDEALASVLDNLTLPGLKALRYNVFHRARGYSLMNFVQRSMPALTCLQIKGEPSDEDMLLPVLGLLPTLKYLRLSDFNVSQRLYQTFAVRKTDDGRALSVVGDEIICPELQILCLDNLSSTDEDECALIDMLQSRYFILGTFRTATWNDGIEITTTLDLSSNDIKDYNWLEWLEGDMITISGDNVLSNISNPFEIEPWYQRKPKGGCCG